MTRLPEPTTVARPSIEVSGLLTCLEAMTAAEIVAAERGSLRPLARQICVRKQLRASYLVKWRRDESAPMLPSDLWPKVITTFLHTASEEVAALDRGLALKNLDVAWHAFALAEETAALGSSGPALRTRLEAQTRVLAEATPTGTVLRGDRATSRGGEANAGQVLPWVILGHEGPQARAYLCALAAAGFSAEHVLWLVGEQHPVHRKRIGRWLPGALRQRYAARVQDLAWNHHPRDLLRRRPELVAAFLRGLEPQVPEVRGWVDAMYGDFRPDAYGEKCTHLMSKGFGDPRLMEKLRSLAPANVLYTGGGIVPKDLLSIPDLNLIHIHPGYLPDVRGADGLLWSRLVTGKLGFTSFFMAPGIDTGDIIVRGEVAAPQFDLGKEAGEERELYRALFGFVDPILRAQFLRDVLLPATDNLRSIAREPQEKRSGRTYHFLSMPMRRAIWGSFSNRPLETWV